MKAMRLAVVAGVAAALAAACVDEDEGPFEEAGEDLDDALDLDDD